MTKFSFSCGKCEEKFNVNFGYFLKKENLSCPNCSNTIPDNSFKRLKTIAESIKEYEKDCDGNEECFTVEIH